MFVIITCGKKKLQTSKEVRLDKLYISRLGKGKIKLARLLTTDDNIFVFSGKLGLVPLLSKSAWYDSENKLPEYDLVARQVKSYSMKATDNILYLGQTKVFKLLKRFYPKIKNLVPDSKGVGDFTRIVYQMIDDIKSKNLTIKEKKVKDLNNFF